MLSYGQEVVRRAFSLRVRKMNLTVNRMLSYGQGLVRSAFLLRVRKMNLTVNRMLSYGQGVVRKAFSLCVRRTICDLPQVKTCGKCDSTKQLPVGQNQINPIERSVHQYKSRFLLSVYDIRP